MARENEIAVLGGGCFWCLEAVFDTVAGVEEVVSGYCGGHVANPTYAQVCEKTTGHAEVVRIAFDPTMISFATLLEIFFTIHDPTTIDRQGNDVGSQYRSVIFCQSEAQRATVREVITRIEASGAWMAPIVTRVESPAPFYPAEGYHQQYFRYHGQEPYCAYVVAPKVAKFRKLFADRLKPR